MIDLIIKWFVNALALYIVSWLLPGVILSDFVSALIAVLVIGLVNVFLKPILLLLTLPINLITLGLFTFVINALLLLLAARITDGFQVDGFLTAIFASILLSIISTMLQTLTD